MDPSRPATMQESWDSPILDALEQQEWLDKAGNYVSKLLQPLLDLPEATPVKNFLHGTWLGHALHPVLTDLPIGCWSSSLLLDLVGAGRSAGVLSAAGSAAAVATALTGVADWTATDGREKRLGLLHGMLNVVGLGFQLASLGARVRRRRLRAISLSATGLTISSAAAWLGGELVFGRGIMVNHDAWLAGPESWTPVLPEAKLADGATRKVEVEGRAVLLYREGARVFAMENACTHAGGPLDEGEVKGGVVTCPWHGSQFRLTDGSVCRGPATYPQLRLQARVQKGQVEIRGRKG
ncbi:MAG: Rieske (2Fe-2S) protein [Chloroflexota bacterium]